MSRRIDLAGFQAKFVADSDPWATFTARDEANKRRAILRALGKPCHARVLELASGNGSNSVALARRAWALDACDGTARAVSLTRARLTAYRRARAHRLVLPGHFPRPMYDAIVIAELLYYLDRRAAVRLARDVARALRPGGRLVLAHHRIDFDDTTRTARGIHRHFLAAMGRRGVLRYRQRNARWQVAGLVIGDVRTMTGA